MEEDNNKDNERDLTQAVKDGSYFSASRRWYSELFHSPIAERNFYSILLVLSLINILFAAIAVDRIFPLKPGVPFVVYSSDIWENVPRILKLAQTSYEDKNIAVMRYMVGDYVINREAYNLKDYKIHFNNIYSHSSPSVFAEYQSVVDVNNGASPYRQYTDQAKRDIKIIVIDYLRGPDTSHAKVIFVDSIISVVNNKEIRHTKWQADISYVYRDFETNQSSSLKNAFLSLVDGAGKGSGEKMEVTPMSFVVTDYKLTELLE